jgi:ABC-3C biological conflict system middle component
MGSLNKEVLAIQNPALGSILIWRAASKYQQRQKAGSFMPLPVSFLVLPIVLHEDTVALVTSTRVLSGLRRLTEKFISAEESKTDLLLAVGARATRMRALTWKSIQLGVTSNVISLDTSDGALMSLSDTPLVSGVPLGIRPLISAAEKLGEWFSGLTLYEIGVQMQVSF